MAITDSTTHHRETHTINNFIELEIEVTGHSHREWQGEVWLRVLSSDQYSDRIRVWRFTRPVNQTLNSVLAEVRAQLEVKFETISTAVVESMRGAEDA